LLEVWMLSPSGRVASESTDPRAGVPDAACQVASLSAHESWMTGGLVYPDVWWQHDCVGLREPLLAELEAHFCA